MSDDDGWEEDEPTIPSEIVNSKYERYGYQGNSYNNNSNGNKWGSGKTDSQLNKGFSVNQNRNFENHFNSKDNNRFHDNDNSNRNGFQNYGISDRTANYNSNYQHQNKNSYNSGFNQRQNGHTASDNDQTTEIHQRKFVGKRNQDEVKEIMEVSKDMVGLIIGRGGSTINDIKEKSGANVFVIREDDPLLPRNVLFRGDKYAVQKARTMVEELINSKSLGSSLMSSKVVEEEKNDTTEYVPPVDWAKAREESKELQKILIASYPPIEKNFYIEDFMVASMDESEVALIRKKHNNIQVSIISENEELLKNGRIPNPVTNFKQAFQHYPEILSEISRAKFETPSPIQMQAWPIILSGRDLIGIAQTGTGKTLAFLLPAFIHIEGQPVPKNERSGPSVLILTPTRELALQIEEEVKKYQYHGIKCVCIYGGGSRKEQIDIVSKGVEIVVATPGRLNDLIENQIIDVRSVTYLVLDEADRMLDLGFGPEIRKSVIHIRIDRQTIMTSATWPDAVRRLANSFTKDPIQVWVGSLDLTAVHSVEQRILMIEEEDKLNELVDLLNNRMMPDDKAIVFMGRKHTVDHISAHFVLEELIECQSIHGGREQCDREQALEDFKSGRVRVLLATDVASRGIDVKDITIVINYDFPHNIEEYVHRVGRTGRAGRTGISLTFISRHDWRYAKELIAIMEEAGSDVPQELYDMSLRYKQMIERKREENRGYEGGRGGGRGGWRGRDNYGGGDRGKWRGSDYNGCQFGEQSFRGNRR